MFWFDGSVRNAVDKVKTSGAFLLVFVHGGDSLSKQYEAYLNEETKFKSDDFVAIKIPHDSVALQQFKQIYVSVPIPSVFLIQNNGVPLNSVSSNNISDLSHAINDAVNKQKINRENKNNVQSNNDVLFNAVSKDKIKATLRPSQHVKNIGRKLFDISEEELKKRLKEIRAFPKFLLINSPTFSGPSSFPKSSNKEHSARIQFLLPNSSMPSWEFPDLSTLGDVKAYLMEKMKLSPNFKVLRTYPRIPFTPQDESKTLAELSLTPNATLIIVPVEDKTVQAKLTDLVQQSILSNMLSTLLQPLFTFLNFFKKHVFKTQNEEDQTPRRLPSDTDVEKVINKKTSTSNIHNFKFDEDTDTDTEHPDNGKFPEQRFHK